MNMKNTTGKAKRFSLLTMVLISLLALFPSGVANAESPDDILVIANNKVGVNSVSLQQLRTMFLKQRQNWKSGGKVFPLNAKPGTPIRKAFQAKVLGMDSTSEQAYWQDQRIRKGISKPSAFSNTLKAVFSVKGSISYCYRKQYKPGLAKVLLVL
jgi:hypothetical protein